MTDAEEVLRLEDTWSVAPLESDLDTVASVVADDWFGVAPTGETMNKSDLLSMLASRPDIFDAVKYSDIKMSIFGDTATVMSAFHGVGRELTLTQRYVRVYAKRENEWRCVATQIVSTPWGATVRASLHPSWTQPNAVCTAPPSTR